jgi:uncharacterized protein
MVFWQQNRKFIRMNNEVIIKKTVEFVKDRLKNSEGGHDWFHIERVWKLSQKIAEKEAANIFIVEMAALLHDIADAKFHNGDEEIGPNTAENFLKSLNLPEIDVNHIVAIIRNISFKGGNENRNHNSIELDIVQDADRIDALGAIGIARTFNYGGFKNRQIYNPEIPPQLNLTKEAYKNSTAPTINHFYEKLLLLKDKMNTKSGKEIADERHRFMEYFLEQFYKEWNSQFENEQI